MLVVGASATGVQLADEIRRSGRRVLLSVGEHVRLPRTYRGRDVLWWMEACGHLEPALRRDRRRRARAQAAVAAARRLAGARDARLERVERGGRRDRGTARRGARRARVVLGRFAQSVRARGSEDESAARVVRRVGARRSRSRSAAARALRADARAERAAARTSISRAARSARSSGRRGSGPTIAGSTCPCSTARGGCNTTAASWPRRACTQSGCRCCAGASRRSFTAPRTTRAMWSSTWREPCIVSRFLSGRPFTV